MASTSSNNEGCIPAIDGQLFDLGCLGPALAIILLLASLERRRKLKLEYCRGHPGLLVPVNFLSKHNRLTVAATFGATASTCSDLFLHGFPPFSTVPNPSLISLTGPPWSKVFQSLLLVFVYGILFYPFFACLTTEYRLTGAILGFFYAVIRFSFKLAIDFQCISYYQGLARNQTLAKISALPTYICLLFVVVRFAVLIFLEVRKKWFQSSSDIHSAGQASETCLVRETTVKYVKKLLNPELNLNVEEVKWFMKPIYFIYKPRADFEFSTQLISTLVVAAIIIFQSIVAAQIIYQWSKKNILPLCSRSETCNDVVGVTFDSFQASCVISAVVLFLLILHFMKCHRDHVLQLYRGQRTFHQNVFASPAKLLRMSLRFSGYQIAFTLVGFLVLDFFLLVFFLILGLIFKFPAVREAAINLALPFLPTIGMALLLWLFQLFLAHFVFLDRDFPKTTFAVDNRRLFSITSYFFFFYNIVLGVIASAFRIIKAILVGLALLPRIDRTSLAIGFQKFDLAFVAYLGFINVLVAHSHPVMLVFCQLLINRHKDRDIAGSQPQKRSVDEHQGSSKENGTSTVFARELRIPRLSHKAVNRWHVAVTLLRNPSLITYRRQGGVTPSVDLGSINADIHALV